MGDHVVLTVDRLMTLPTTEPEKSEDLERTEASCVNISTSRQQLPGSSDSAEVSISSKEDEREPLIQVIECRICQEEDHIKNLETPCACSGSLKYAHRKCVQRWCNEKGDVTCEICHQAYKPGYTAPPPLPVSDDTIIDISGGWAISGRQLDLRDPRLLAIAAAERRFVEAEYDDYASTNASGAAFCRSAALFLMALLLLRHTLSITNADGENDDASAIFSIFLIRVASFLLPCYIMAWAISVLQRRRQQQEAAALAAADVAFVLHAGQRVGLQFTAAPALAPNPAPAPPPAPTAHQDQP